MAQYHRGFVLFRGGRYGYHSYRIPSIVRTGAGTLLAFAEGRKSSNEDHGNINLVYRRSTDHGVHWSVLHQVVGQGPGTWGNPTAVVDRETERIWLFLSWNSGDHAQKGSPAIRAGRKNPIDDWGERRVMVTWSDDDGASWAEPDDMTATLLPQGYDWDAMGPGVGTQTRIGAKAGRLIVPAIGRNIYSDDHGQSWRYQKIPGGTSEGTILELLNGKLMRNDRAVKWLWETRRRRMLSFGSIEKKFWSPWMPHGDLLDPRCQASLLRYTASQPARILFLNPASATNRWKMRVRLSYDEGRTWPVQRLLPGPDSTSRRQLGGYSSMAKTANFRVVALVEQNEDRHNNDTSHRSIVLHRFNLDWILDGKTEDRGATD